MELISNLPTLRSYSSSHYTLPFINSQFPEISGETTVPKLHLASRVSDKISWSHGIDLCSEHSIFVSLPELYDVKVYVARSGHTMHIYIDPVSRAEISAKEIRSRIKKGKMTRVTVESPTKADVPRSPEGPITPPQPIGRTSSVCSDNSVRRLASTIEEKSMQVEINCLCSRISGVLLDETTRPCVASEFLCVTADEVGLSCYPQLDVIRSTSSRLEHSQHLAVSMRDLQIDNQLYGKASYDFPVILEKQDKQRRSSMSIDLETAKMLDINERLALLLNHSLLCICIELHREGGSATQVSFQTSRLSLKPIKLFIEDTYIRDFLRVLDRIVPTSFSGSSVAPSPSVQRRRPIPFRVRSNAMTMNVPIRMRHLSIEPINLLISVHASLKLFIASDNTPLSFGRFERHQLCTTSQQLIKALAMHYASGALFRAGMSMNKFSILLLA